MRSKLLVTPASVLVFAPRALTGWLRRGEQDPQLASLVAPLRQDGYEVLPAVQTVLGTIECVVVGPTGIFVVESKSWRGWIRLSRSGRLRHNWRNAQADLRTAGRDAIEVRRILSSAGARSWVYPILVLTQGRLPRVLRIDTTTVCGAEDLLGTIRSREHHRLDPDQVTQAVSAILLATVPLEARAG